MHPNKSTPAALACPDEGVRAYVFQEGVQRP